MKVLSSGETNIFLEKLDIINFPSYYNYKLLDNEAINYY